LTILSEAQAFVDWDLRQVKHLINKKYYPLLMDRHRFLVLVGGGGSGKSHFIAQNFLIRILLGIARGIKHNIPGLRRTQPAVRHSVFETFKTYINAWKLDGITDIKESTMDIYFMGGSRINCGGLDNQEKIKSYERMTSAWYEEATEALPMDIIQLNLRLRGKMPCKKQIALSFNPIDENSFLKTRFCDDPPENAIVVRSDYRDNQFLNDPEYERELEALKEQDENLWRIYARGEWGALKNLIYTNYEILDDSEWPEQFDEVIYGLDHGYNSPAALVEVGILDEEMYARELLYESGLNANALIGRLEELDISRSAYIYPDVSRPEINDQIYDAGFNVVKKEDVKNDVKSGIDFLKTRKPKIHGASQNFIKEIRSYKYKEDRDGNVPEGDPPVKAFDHLMDAWRYAAYSYFGGMGLTPKFLGYL
jgi:phage terminase large subunit